jgi:hypothetical protein
MPLSPVCFRRALPISKLNVEVENIGGENQ